jgi:hypothetical protein
MMNIFEHNQPELGQWVVASKDGMNWVPFCYASKEDREDEPKEHDYKYWKEIKE